MIKAGAIRCRLVTRAYSPHPEPPVLRAGDREENGYQLHSKMYSKGMVYMADLVEDVLLNIMHKIRMDVIKFVAVNRDKIPEMK